MCVRATGCPPFPSAEGGCGEEGWHVCKGGVRVFRLEGWNVAMLVGLLVGRQHAQRQQSNLEEG